jgi:hypothetical protein
MKVKGYKYCLIFDKKGVIINPNDFKQEINEEATVEVYDTFATAIGFNSLKQLEKYITNNNLTFPEQEVKINPFDAEWDGNYQNANLRMFIDAINAMKLSIEQPEFVMLLKQRNIKLIVDENYGGTWAYLEEIEKEHKKFLEKDYGAKFEYRNV